TLLGFTWEMRGWNQQARSTSQPVDSSAGPNDNWRRQWQTEAALGRGFGSRVGADLRWIYQSRTETWGPPLGPGTFDGIDRLLQLEVPWDATARSTCGPAGCTIASESRAPATSPISHGVRGSSPALTSAWSRVSAA